jgi:hypothetical protein
MNPGRFSQCGVHTQVSVERCRSVAENSEQGDPAELGLNGVEQRLGGSGCDRAIQLCDRFIPLSFCLLGWACRLRGNSERNRGAMPPGDRTN